MILRAIKRSLFAFVILLMPVAAMAQAPTPAVPASADQLLKPGELDALVAPIALYPDTLLAQVLMASTYPLEVVQADRWASENKTLKGDALKAAAEKQAWDDSVKALVATPDVLAMMSSKLDWTQKLGDAVLAQEPDVMDAIQRLRQKAQANNKLPSNKQQKVTVRQETGKQVIAIEPTDPNTVYVPYYDPGVVYGSWPYPDYPPYYWGYPSYIGAGLIATGVAFGAGYALGRWTSGRCCWGGGNIDWNRNNINIGSGDRVTNWQHNPQHRQGVRYNNANVRQQFGNANIRAGAQNRIDFRGRSGEQVLKPGGGAAATRPGAAERPTAATRPSKGGGTERAAQRPSKGGGPQRAAAQRPAPRSSNNAFANVQRGSAARAESARGMASLGGAGGARFAGSGGPRVGGPRAGGGRRSDIALKHDIVLLGRLDNGLGFYRFSYNGRHKAYVGVIAQEVQAVEPQAVVRGRDGYLRVYYDKLGVPFETYHRWIATGAHVPAGAPIH